MAAARTPPSRISAQKIIADLRLAAKKGDRMRTLALSPRYWEKYLLLLRNPHARLVDLLVIKQGERIAHQKGWKLPKPSPAPPKSAAKTRKSKPSPGRARAAASTSQQPSLFE
jgi:hypothetical protein